MAIRCTITKPGVVNEYGQALAIGTVYTPNNDDYALALIAQLKATDTDDVLGERINTSFNEIVTPVAPVGSSDDKDFIVSPQGDELLEISWAGSRLQRAAVVALANNAESSAVTSLATQTAVASLDASLTRTYGTVSAPQRFAYAGGVPSTNTSSNRVLMPVSSVLPATNGNLSGNLLSGANDRQAWSAWLGVRTDSAKLAYGVAAFAGRNFRVIVDDGTGPKFINKTPAATNKTDGSKSWVEIDFAGVYAVRDVWIEIERNTGIYDVSVEATSDVQPAEVRNRCVALFAGDSYSESQGASYVGLGWVPIASRLLGITDARQVAVGATGYFATNGGTRSTLRNQIPNWLGVNTDLTASEVDLIVIAAGYNDRAAVAAGTYTAAQVGIEAAACVQAARAAFPQTAIVVAGLWAAATGPDATITAIEAAVESSVEALADSKVRFLPVSTDVYPWIFGTGYVGATNGSGNSDRAITTDGIHPSDAGHALIAARFAGAFRQSMGM